MDLISLLRNLPGWFDTMIAQHGAGIYTFLFLIVFAETGLVVTPFLPGDSLLFTAGTFTAGEGSKLSLPLLYLLFFSAAFLGDNVNYTIGKFLGPRLFANPNSRIFQRKNLDKTHAFFEKHGWKAIILARFVPIVRTFMPFVAGMGAMTYGRFLVFSVIASLLWVGICVTAGHLFGNIPFVKKHFEAVVLGIVLVSIVPAVIEVLNHRRAAAKEKAE